MGSPFSRRSASTRRLVLSGAGKATIHHHPDFPSPWAVLVTPEPLPSEEALPGLCLLGETVHVAPGATWPTIEDEDRAAGALVFKTEADALACLQRLCGGGSLH